jgi:hypothetical protein
VIRKITAISLAFLLALLPVQKVLGKKIRIGFLNNIMLDYDYDNINFTDFEDEDEVEVNLEWVLSIADEVETTQLLESDEATFDSFVKAANKLGIEKIIKLPYPLVDFRPVDEEEEVTSFTYSCNYIDLASGEYKCNPFHRIPTHQVSSIPNVHVSFVNCVRSEIFGYNIHSLRL